MQPRSTTMVARGIVVRRIGEGLRAGLPREDRSGEDRAAIRAPRCGSFRRTVNFQAHGPAAGQLSGARAHCRSTFGRTVNHATHGRHETVSAADRDIHARPRCHSCTTLRIFRAHGQLSGARSPGRQLSGARSRGRATFRRTVLRPVNFRAHGQPRHVRSPQNCTHPPACLSWRDHRQGSPP